ncbi:unnamed protein product, partial [marine sediment metagenome]
MRIDKESLLPGSEEHVIRLKPLTVIRGTVTDIESDEPVDNFHIIEGVFWSGRDEVWWNRGDSMQFTSERYEIRLDDQRPGSQIRVEADGYQPAVSERF